MPLPLPSRCRKEQFFILAMTKDKEKRIDEVLRTFGHRCKTNIDGGRTWQEDLKAMVKMTREAIVEIVEGKESKHE